MQLHLLDTFLLLMKEGSWLGTLPYNERDDILREEQFH